MLNTNDSLAWFMPTGSFNGFFARSIDPKSPNPHTENLFVEKTRALRILLSN
jgi:hypothetical protein